MDKQIQDLSDEEMAGATRYHLGLLFNDLSSRIRKTKGAVSEEDRAFNDRCLSYALMAMDAPDSSMATAGHILFRRAVEQRPDCINDALLQKVASTLCLSRIDEHTRLEFEMTADKAIAIKPEARFRLMEMMADRIALCEEALDAHRKNIDGDIVFFEKKLSESLSLSERQNHYMNATTSFATETTETQATALITLFASDLAAQDYTPYLSDSFLDLASKHVKLGFPLPDEAYACVERTAKNIISVFLDKREDEEKPMLPIKGDLLVKAQKALSLIAQNDMRRKDQVVETLMGIDRECRAQREGLGAGPVCERLINVGASALQSAHEARTGKGASTRRPTSHAKSAITEARRFLVELSNPDAGFPLPRREGVVPIRKGPKFFSTAEWGG